ncbi:MAG TPA: flagellar basal body P-ring formation chaperone FlgA [Hyphomonadaceae bacterium]|nr:flagellar basal body P-ring formation chaperone FlgA [Hyphomonadaceae bacterium]HPN07431.1 flagellar basal body P-ring formation chaperone FlgA [Hyphomonadaceae bacterium]
MVRIAALVFSVLMLAPLAVAQRTGVKVIGGDWITLGDVAPVTGEHAGILLGPAPPAGQTLSLDPAFLIATAKSAGVILAIPLDQPILVTRAAGNAPAAPVANPARPANQIQQVGSAATSGQVLVFARDVSRGHVITSSDVSREAANPARPIRGGADMQAAVGMEVKRAIKAGQPLLSSDLKQASVIRKGEPVKLVYVSAGVRLSVDGIAQNEAAKGEAVRVLNSYSKRTVDAVAEATGEARVNGR